MDLLKALLLFSMSCNVLSILHGSLILLLVLSVFFSFFFALELNFFQLRALMKIECFFRLFSLSLVLLVVVVVPVL